MKEARGPVVHTQLIVLRHAEAEHLVSSVRGGTNDTALTAKGRLQADRTALALVERVGTASVRVSCAPSSRARNTAEAVGHALHTQPVADTALATLAGEPQDGENEAPLDAAFLSRHPRVDWKPYRNAETWRSLHRRVQGFLATATSPTLDYHVVVTHGVTHIALVQAWLGLSEATLETSFFVHQVSPCGITRLGRDAQGFPCLFSLNDESHLGSDLRTLDLGVEP